MKECEYGTFTYKWKTAYCPGMESEIPVGDKTGQYSPCLRCMRDYGQLFALLKRKSVISRQINCVAQMAGNKVRGQITGHSVEPILKLILANIKVNFLIFSNNICWIVVREVEENVTLE